MRTRAGLVVAARRVFERDGYLEARVTDITSLARCSTGTFYTYFDGKEEIFSAVLESAKDEMMYPGLGQVEAGDVPALLIEASNRAYFEAYARNAKLMDLLEQVATIDPQFREVRRQRSREFFDRNAKGIARMQAHGLVDARIDPVLTSRALSVMVSRLAYLTYVLGDSVPMESLVEVSTVTWCRTLGIDVPRSVWCDPGDHST